MSSQISPFDRPVHITCQHCKHFHKNWEYPLPPSGGRVKCARCKTDMFYLGRADTQYTLASVDSIPLSQLGPNNFAGTESCSDAPQPRSGILAHLPSEYIPPQSQPFLDGQRSVASTGSQLHGTGLQLPEMQSDAPTNNDGFRSPTQFVSTVCSKVLQKVPFFETWLGASGYVNTLGTKVAAGLPQTRREYNIFGWRFVIQPPDNDVSDHATASLNLSQHSDIAAAGSVQNQPSITTESHDNSNKRSPPESVTPAVHSAQAVSSSDSANLLAVAGAPSGRLVEHRRHKTLVRSALQQFNCRCRGDCHCILRTVEPPTSDSELGDAHSSRVRTPPHLDEIPSNPVIDRLGARRFLFFSHVGHSTENSDDSLDTSQASTLGSGGSVLLRPGRPRSTARSRSMPGH